MFILEKLSLKSLCHFLSTLQTTDTMKKAFENILTIYGFLVGKLLFVWNRGMI